MTNSTIILNVKTPVNLRDVYVIERVTDEDRAKLAEKTGLPASRFAVFQSHLRLIDGSNLLATQGFEEIAAKAGHRLIVVRAEKQEKGRHAAVQLAPIDAIRHIEFVAPSDHQAIKERYKDADPARIDALKTRIVYFGLSAKSIAAARPGYFTKMFPIDLRQDLKGLQKLNLVAIGHNRYLLADEIADAVDLSEAEIRSLERKYNLRSKRDGDLTTTITLRNGDLIMSSIPAVKIAEKFKRALPSNTVAVDPPHASPAAR